MNIQPGSITYRGRPCTVQSRLCVSARTCWACCRHGSLQLGPVGVLLPLLHWLLFLQMEELQEEQQEEYGSPSRPEPAALPASNSSPSGDTAATTAAAPAVNGSSTQHEAAESSSTASTSATPQQQQREASSSSASKPSSKDADAVADLDFEAEEMSYWERQLLSASIQLLKASTAVVKAFGKALLQGDVLSAGTDRLDSWESCLWHTKHLRRAVEDLGAALYPTQVSTCKHMGRTHV